MMQHIQDILEYRPELEQANTCSWCGAQFPLDDAFKILHMKVVHNLIV